ncbi:hypothetical protein Tco_0977013 [Tanacetum coccineum]|uniref:Uncharacterized protein n=1 Tax=Tanacetum coccineum TaxID=301880 RepID=A0ABQ5EIU8_9ASTR
MLCSFSGMGEKIVELEKSLAKQTKENSDLSMKIDNQYAFAFELKRASTKRMTAFEEEKRVFVSKITHLEQIIAQQTKDFENAKIELFKKNQFNSFSELENKSGMKKNLFESETCIFQIKIVELEKTLAKQTKENSDLLMKIDNLENAFADEVKRVTTGKLNVFDKENYDFGSKVTHLEKIIAQKTKDFDDIKCLVKLECLNRTANLKRILKKNLINTKVVS